MFRISLALLAVAVSAVAAEAPLLSLIPAEAKVIGGIHVDRTVNSPFGQFVLAQINNDEKGLQEIITTTGFDPRRDLREIVFASTTGQKGPGVVLARGVFNGPQILAALRAKGGGTVTNYKGVDVLEGAAGKGGAIAIAEGATAFAGDPALVRASLDRRAGATGTGALTAKATAVSGRYDAWMVTSGQLVAPLPRSGAKGSTVIPSLEGILETSGGLTFGSIIRFAGEAITRSDKDALALADVVRFLGSMIQLNGGNNPELQKLQPIFDSLEVKAAANVVTMSFAIPQVDLEKLAPAKRTVQAAR